MLWRKIVETYYKNVGSTKGQYLVLRETYYLFMILPIVSIEKSVNATNV